MMRPGETAGLNVIAAAHCHTSCPSEYNMQEHTLWLRMLLALTLIFSAAAGMAQERERGVIPNTVLVGADGKYEADPDTVLVQFNIAAQNETLQAASDRAKQAAEQVRDLLRKNGLDPKLAQIGQFVVSPVYDYKTPEAQAGGLSREQQHQHQVQGLRQGRPAHQRPVQPRRHRQPIRELHPGGSRTPPR